MKIKVIKKKLFLIVMPSLIGVFISFLIFAFFLENNAINLLDKEGINSPPDFVEINNEPFPTAKLNDISSNVDFLEKIKSKKVLLVFLMTECIACKKEAENIGKIYPKLLSEVKVYGISFESKEKLSTFVQENQIEFPVLQTDNELFKKFNIKYFPTNFYVEDGIIKKSWVGISADEQQLFEKIKNAGDAK